jgi:PhnB protein
MKAANPYLNFNGKTEEAFNFYKSVFGGEFTEINRFSNFKEGEKIPPDAKNMIMHISLPLGPHNLLMGSDAPESMGFKLSLSNNFSILLETESESEATRLFNGLAAGGKVTMELQKTFWGAFYGMCVDKYGIQWMVNFSYQK